ncbi:MAG TPA: GNAT family N-acetyltransferase [Thermoanaerobaculia bacterium]|nr:GNAT family N-acetyltransferase [Thermoanaerobaculia bacterium]
MPVSDFTVRPFADGDERAILDLFARSFPHAPRPLAHFDWKYRRNPFGNRRISLTFDDEGRLVGHYSGYPVPFHAFGKTVFAHQIGDTMTEVAVRHVGRGPTSILGRTALDFYARFCEEKIAFNFGFNVANIQKFSLRFLRSDRVEPVTYRVREPLPPLKRSDRWLRGYQFELVRATTGEWDELFARVSSAYRLLLRRDAEYVRWRYLQCPDVQYQVVAIRKWRQLVGWIVFRIRDERFTWGDALFHPEFPDAVEVVLRHIVPSYPVRLIEAWFPPRPRWFDERLTGLGFRSEPEPQNLSLMCVPFVWKDVVARMREELYYTWGDGDLF